MGGLLLIALIILASVYLVYQWIEGPSVTLPSEETIIHIPADANYESMIGQLVDSGYVSDIATLTRVASWMKYGEHNFKPGRYLLTDGMSNRDLISLLRSGRQSPVMVTINNVRTVDQLAGKLTAKLELDSQKYYHYLLDSDNYSQSNLDSQNLLTLFIPNTYEVFWDISAEGLTSRMSYEHEQFWKKNQRLNKANELEMSAAEVYTLASIVERETQTSGERPIVAGLYLNRLRVGIPLQADPTVVFAVGDFGIRRVLNKHLIIDSPYNTYLYAGLPPGPICMPSVNSIDAVLNAAKHNYLYMCAQPDSREHVFAASLTEHNRNANVYRRWLNKKGIMK